MVFNYTCERKNIFYQGDMLGAVDLSGVKFIQFKTDLIVPRVLYYNHFIKKRATRHILCLV